MRSSKTFCLVTTGTSYLILKRTFICGFIKAIMVWIVTGSFFYGDKVQHLPFSTEGCINGTYLEGNSTTLLHVLDKLEDNTTLTYTFNNTDIIDYKNETIPEDNDRFVKYVFYG